MLITLRAYRVNTGEPSSNDTLLIRTPVYYVQFILSRQKAHIFSLKLTQVCPKSQIPIYRQP